MNKKYLILTILLVVAAITRLIPHPLNFAPIGAMALASGAYFGRNLWAFLAPLCIYWFSDLLVNNLLYSEFYNSFVLFTPGFGWLYISFAAIVLLGSLVFSKITLPRILGGALGASIIFFIVSNFGVWLSDPDYPLTVEGLILCYEMAIPFFRSTVSGDLIYSGVLFGLMEWSRSSSMAWGWGSSAAQILFSSSTVMFELFPDQPVYDYPTLINVAYSLFWAFALSSIIAITHRLTYTGPEYPKHLFQSLALGSIVAAMVMMAIGDSLARGLGAFGALAMIRFRTRIQDPKNILFIFASLSSGLAVGVYGYTIAFAGTLLFCGMALVLHYTNFTTRGEITADLTVRLTDGVARDQVVTHVQEHVLRFHEKSTTVRENRINCTYGITLPYPTDHHPLLEKIKHIEGVERVSLSYREAMEEI